MKVKKKMPHCHCFSKTPNPRPDKLVSDKDEPLSLITPLFTVYCTFQQSFVNTAMNKLQKTEF